MNPNHSSNLSKPFMTSENYGDAMERAFMLDIFIDSLNPSSVAESPWDPYANGPNYMAPQANPNRFPPHGWPVALPPESHGEMFLNNSNVDQLHAQQGRPKQAKYSPPMEGTAGMPSDPPLFQFDELMAQNNNRMSSSAGAGGAAAAPGSGPIPSNPVPLPGGLKPIAMTSASRDTSKPSSKKRKLLPEEKRQKKLAAQVVAKERRRERNKVLARKTRAKRKEELVLLIGEVKSLQRENSILREMTSVTLPDPSCSKWLLKCDEDIPPDVVEIVDKMISRAESDVPLNVHAFCVSNGLNPNLPIVYASPGFSQLTGYPVEEMVGKNCRFLQGPGTDKKETERIRIALERGEEVEATIQNYRKDGSAFMNNLKISPIIGVDKKPILFVGVQQLVDKAPLSSNG